MIESILEEGDRPFSLAEIADRVRMLTPHFPPSGASDDAVRARYSDTITCCLRRLLRRLPERRFTKSTKMLPSAGHAAHRFPGTESAGTRVSGMTYAPAASPAVPQHRVLQRNAAAADLLAFSRALVGAKSTGARNLALQQGGWLDSVSARRAALRAPGWPIRYGMGMMRFRLPRVFTPLASILVVGHTGSTGCWLFYCLIGICF